MKHKEVAEDGGFHRSGQEAPAVGAEVRGQADLLGAHVRSCFQRADAGKMTAGLGTGCGIMAQVPAALRRQIKQDLGRVLICCSVGAARRFRATGSTLQFGTLPNWQMKNEFPIRQ